MQKMPKWKSVEQISSQRLVKEEISVQNLLDDFLVLLSDSSQAPLSVSRQMRNSTEAKSTLDEATTI